MAADNEINSYLLYVNLNVLLQVVAVQIEDQVVDEVKTVTNDDERQLVSQFGLLHRTKEIEIPYFKSPRHQSWIQMFSFILL